MTQTFAQIVQHLTPGGIERLALDLTSEPPLGDQGLLISLEGSREEAFHAWPALREVADRIVFMDKRPGLDPRLALRLAGLLRRSRVGWVHTHHLGPLIYGGLAARLAPGVRWLHTEHDAWHLEDPAQASLTRRCLSLLRPVVTSVATHVKTGITQATGWSDVTVVRNGVDTRRFTTGDQTEARHALSLPRDKTIIGLAGRLEPEKNQSLALHAFARLNRPDSFLAIAGHGSQRGLLEQIACELGLGGRIRFLGHVEDMVTFYRSLDLFCLPSLSEGLPLSLLEAQACGTPVVATDVGGCSEAVCPHTGRLVPPADTESLIEAFRAMSDVEAPGAPRQFALDNGSAMAMRGAYRELLS